MKAATPLRWIICHANDVFQSTRPVKAATPLRQRGTLHDDRFQSTRPVKAATAWPDLDRPRESVSIHAAREGRDNADVVLPNKSNVSIHAAREGRDWSTTYGCNQRIEFQSTRPVKAATRIHTARGFQRRCFNPRGP